jgi:antitoxin HicB
MRVEYGWPIGMPVCRPLTQGIFEGVQVQAIKEVLAWQIKQAIKTQGLTKAEMAYRMQTSRAQLDRLLDPKNTSVTLHTLERAATILGKRVRLDLVEAWVCGWLKPNCKPCIVCSGLVFS